MDLNHSQKKYIKNAIHSSSISDIAKYLQIPEDDVEEYIRNKWGENRLTHLKEGTQTNTQKATNLLTWIKFNWKELTLLFVLIFIAYINSAFNQFTYDDIAGIVQNTKINDIHFIFSSPIYFFRPFVYYITYQLAGLNPFWFRFTNYIFHIGTVFALYGLIKLLLNRRVALIAASIFAVHPILVETVVSISNNSYSMYAFFLLTSFICYILNRNSRYFLYISFILFALSLLSSEKALVYPIILFVYEFLFGDLKKNWWKIAAMSIVLFIHLPTLFFLQNKVAIDTHTSQATAVNTYFNPLTQIPLALSTYVSLIFFPANLTVYHTDFSSDLLPTIARYIVVVLYIAALIYTFKINKKIFFWLSFFIITLIPVLTPFRIAFIAAERYVYLGFAGIVVVIGMLFDNLLTKQKYKIWTIGILFILIGLCIIRTIVRNTDWNNEDAFWQATEKSAPFNPANHNNVGYYYFTHGRIIKSIAEYSKAIALDPTFNDAYFNRANAYLETNQDELALNDYKTALKYNPQFGEAYLNMGAIYLDRGDIQTAYSDFQKALALEPSNPRVYLALGYAYTEMGRKSDAIKSFINGLQLNPSDKQLQQALRDAQSSIIPSNQLEKKNN